MPKFNRIQQLRVNPDRTATMTLYDLEGEPQLELAPATEANKPYFNALLKKQRKNIGRARARNFSAGMTKEARDNDRELYATHVARGWKRVKDDDGNDVSFTVENARAFFEALPDHIFDEVRLFATDPHNFVSEGVDVEELSGNSQSD
jgi:hypothetical protein